MSYTVDYTNGGGFYITTSNNLSNQWITQKTRVVATKPQKVIPNGYVELKLCDIVKESDISDSAWRSELNKATIDIIGHSYEWSKACFGVTVYRKQRKIEEVSEKQTIEIICYLKYERAFNADSAIEIKGNELLEICEILTEKGTIKCIDNKRFWVEN